MARASSCRTRSLETPKRRPISCNVCGSRCSSRPKRCPQDAAFTLIQCSKHAVECRADRGQVVALVLVVRQALGNALEQLVAPGLVAVAVALVLGDRAGVVLHDRPRRIGAELEAARVVELLDGAHQRDVAVADDLEEIGASGWSAAWRCSPPGAGWPA